MSVVALKFFRDTNKYTQEYLAKILDISQPAYSKLESGNTKISEDVATTLGELYGVDKRIFTEDETAIINYNIGTQHSGIIKAENYYEKDTESLNIVTKKVEDFFVQFIDQHNKILKELITVIAEFKK